MTTLLATGDLHLGAHPEYGRAPGDRLRVQGDVLGRILGLAVEHNVDAILNTGDTFDGPGIPPEQLDIYAGFVAAADEFGIPIVAITGNGKHDAAMRTVNGMQIFNRIPGITVCSRPAVVEVAGVAVACLPWVSPGRIVARNGGGDRDEVNRDAADLLIGAARELRAQIPAETPAVLAYHGSVSGATTPDGALTDLFREPVLDAWQVEQAGFDAIICGHIHRPQFLNGEDGTPFFYVGSPLPLNFGESSCEHGVTVLELDEAGALVHLAFIPVESPSFVTLDFDHDDPAAQIALSASLGWDVPARSVVRVKVRATPEQWRGIEATELRRGLLDAGAAVVKIVPDIARADRARVDGVDETLAPLAALDLWIDANDETARADLLRARTVGYLEAVAA